MPPPIRGSDVFLKEDLRNILRSILATQEMVAKQSNSDDLDAYRRGFVAAFAAMAVALDISLDMPHLRHWVVED